MGVVEYPLASPLPTAPPSTRDVNRKLRVARDVLARDEENETCGWVDGDFGINAMILRTRHISVTDRYLQTQL